MKKLILSLSILALTLGMNAQSRTNKEPLQFSSKSEKLTKATGWEQSKKTGKWIENKNVIDDRKCPKYYVSHIRQNFKWMQFATISKSGQKYYVFLYERLGGKYKYPSIYEDWEADYRKHYFIMTPSEYESIKTQIDLKTGENIKIKSKMNDYFSNRYQSLGEEYLYNESNLLAKINKTIETPYHSEKCFIINSQVVDGQEVVRFRLPEDCYFAEDYMKTKYFEVNANDFKKILTD